MALVTQVVPIHLGQGVDTKGDPRQIPAGKLTALENGMFTPGNEIVKRPGFAAEPSGPTVGLGLVSYNNELIALDGQSLWSLSQGQNQFNNKGSLVLTQLQTTTVVRNTTNQTIQDSALNGSYSCYTWANGGTAIFCSVFDVATGQVILSNATVSTVGTLSKVLALGSSFYLLYYDNVSKLLYKTIATATPTTLSAAGTIATDINTANPIFDAEVFNSRIYIAYPNNTGSQVSTYFLTSGSLSAQRNLAATVVPTVVSIFGDASNNAWLGYSAGGTSATVFGAALNAALSSTVVAPTSLGSVAGDSIHSITGYVSGTTATYFYGLKQDAAFVSDSLTPRFVRTNTLTIAAAAGVASVFMRGIDLASKVVVYNSTPYFWVTTQSPLQSTYFLVNSSALICAKLSPGNGGGYGASTLLPELNNVSSGVYQTASLIKDNLTSTSGTVYTQTGVQSAQVTFVSSAPSKFVLGDNLHVATGLLEMYDGANVVEHGYNLFPEGLSGSLTFPSSSTGGTSANSLVLSPVLSFGGSFANTNTNQWQYSAIYEWSDNQGQLHRSAPSVPLTVSSAGWGAVATLTGGTGTGGTIAFASIPPTVSAGMYVVLVGGSGTVDGSGGLFLALANNRINSVSTTAIVLSVGITGTVTGTNTLTMVVSSHPISWMLVQGSGSFTNATSATVTNTDYSNVAVGQTLIPTQNSGSLFSPGTYITALTGTSSADIGLSFNSPLLVPFATANNRGNGVSFYSFDIASATVSVPTLKQTAKTQADIALYRTELNQDLFYRISSPTALTYNDKTVDSVGFSDTTIDSNIVGNEQLYTTGGTIENIEVPAPQIATTFKSRAIIVPSENQLSWQYSQQVIPGVPVQFNDSFIQNVDAKIGTITSVGTLDEKIILFGPTSKYFVVGDGPAPSGLNNDFIYPQKIIGNTGCSNQASLLETPMGLIYQDQTKGIHLLDRSLQEQYIGADVEQYNSQVITSAQAIPGTKLIRMTLNNGSVLTYDLFYNQWGVDQYATAATDSTLFQNNFIWLSSSGTAFSETSGTWTDSGAFIPLSLTTGWMNVEAMQGFMRVKKLMILGTYFSPHTLNVNIYTDYNDTTPVQTVAIPVLVAPTIYQYWIVLKKQKCEAIKIQISDAQASNFGQGFSLSSLAFEIGMKKGTQKLPAGQGY